MVSWTPTKRFLALPGFEIWCRNRSNFRSPNGKCGQIRPPPDPTPMSADSDPPTPPPPSDQAWFTQQLRELPVDSQGLRPRRSAPCGGYKRAETSGKNGGEEFDHAWMLLSLFQFLSVGDRSKNKLKQHRLLPATLWNALRKKEFYANIVKQTRNVNRLRHVTRSALTLV